MHLIEESVFIAAPPAKVWAILIDLGTWSTWNTFVINAKTLPPHQRPVVGSEQVITVAAKSASSSPAEYSNKTIAVKDELELRWAGQLLFSAILHTEHWCLLESTNMDGVEGTMFMQGEKFEGLLVPVGKAMGLFEDMRQGYVRMNGDLKRVSEMVEMTHRKNEYSSATV
ncbi:hypothetical protein JX265_011791 [Neoarthrinium moseri]|uniref:Uncharacterized protein n=1 Tax=Neoarthrinium moseri TaxID=1658444 RepID=A0A9Q0AJE3_9PEZI|nr:hypothetical protein JX265_011791 [Neoarthrinium moseri]